MLIKEIKINCRKGKKKKICMSRRAAVAVMMVSLLVKKQTKTSLQSREKMVLTKGTWVACTQNLNIQR